jgi:hypothetical protein
MSDISTEDKLKKQAAWHRAWSATHKDRIRAYDAKRRDQKRAYYATHKDKFYAKQLKQVYGISLIEFNTILKNQGNVCKICGATKSGGRSGKFVVDHDHKTGKIRGLLCHRCNTALGNFYDDRSILASAILYLQELV